MMMSLALASLLGWTCVHDGQGRIQRRLPRAVAALLFVVLPIGCALLSLAGPRRIESWGGPAPSHWIWPCVRWYGPVAVVANLVAFVTWKARGRYGRGAWFALLIAPYAALFAYLVFGVDVAGLDEAHHATMSALGSWAVALQLALAFFVGGRD